MKLRRFLSCILALLLASSLPVSALADEYDLSEGSVTVNASESGQTVTHKDTTKPDSAPVITQSTETTSNTITIKAEENATANVTIQDVNIVNSDPVDAPQNHSGQAAVTIDVADGAEANVTLDGVTIDVAGTGGDIESIGDKTGEAAVQITGNGNVTLELDGKNTLQSGHWRAGVEKNSGGELTITDENETHGSLKATGGVDGSGIGGGNLGNGSDITITGSAEVTAQGGIGGSGIGGGVYGDGDNITITGSAEVTAKGGVNGAGIGGGYYGNGDNITITGSAEVTAKGGIIASGIGGGVGSTGSNITISEDAQVKAQGGNAAGVWGAGSSIGGGGDWNKTGVEVTPDTAALNEGWIATYTPGTTDLDTTPDSLTYKDNNGNLATSDNAVPFAKQEPTCTEGGYRAGFMIGNTKIGGQTLNATGHNMGAYHTETPATCQKEGVERRDCANCDYFETSTLGIVDHSYGDYSSDDNATCTADGTKTRKCIWCGLKDTVTDPGTIKEHSFTNYISDKNATYDADGTKTAKCDHCDATDTIPDPGSKLVRKEAPQTAPLYRVIGQDGKAIACKAEQKGGVLTITVDADFATLTGSFSGLKTLKAQGVDTIVFVTNGAASTFAIADLLAQGGDSYALTHDGETVTFTLGNGTDISKILK